MKATQIIVNREPKEVFRSLKEAKAEGKRLIRAWKRQDVILGINIQYKFV
jgi:hypothetical protein